MRDVQVTITFQVADDVTDEAVQNVVYTAVAQVDEGVDEEGEPVETGRVDCSIEFG